jgi:hypothetical protein
MKLPDHVFAIAKALHTKHLTFAHGNDAERRTLQKMLVETVVARHPGEGWGWKSAGVGRPPSKDAIANNKLMPGHLVAWDCFDGTTRQPVQREAEVIDGQLFIEVTGVDHLAEHPIAAPQPPPAPIVMPAPVPPAAALIVTRQEFLDGLFWLDRLYREQLGRANGVDFEGIAAHLFDVYLDARRRGASVDEAKGRAVRQINEILGRTDIHP